MSNQDNKIKPQNIKIDRRHQKTPSLRELMLGKKTVKSLPENFFEKVLDLEIKLKKGFRIEVLQELVNYYSNAIEYYESIEDPRYKDFQMSLNVLLSQPEILKKMNTLNNNKGGEENTIGYSARYIKKEQVKKQMKMKVDYAINTQNNNQNTDKQVKQIMKEVDQPQNNIDTIVNKDIESQEENFKKRRDEKRKKTLLSTSDLTEHIQTIKNRGYNLDKSQTNKSFIIESKKNVSNNDIINFNITSEVECEKDLSFTGKELQDDITPNHNNHNLLNFLENSFDENIQKEQENDLSFDKVSIDNSNNKSGLIFNNGRLKAPKHKQIFNDLKHNMDNFLEEFNFYFFEDVFHNVVEEIQKILEEKHKKTLVISKDYNNQIKEYEFLITSDNESDYKESLQATIEQLKEELETELEKLDDHYDQLIKEHKQKFKHTLLKTNSGIQLIEEKFRLDMFNSISNIMLPNKVPKSSESK